MPAVVASTTPSAAATSQRELAAEATPVPGLAPSLHPLDPHLASSAKRASVHWDDGGSDCTVHVYAMPREMKGNAELRTLSGRAALKDLPTLLSDYHRSDKLVWTQVFPRPRTAARASKVAAVLTYRYYSRADCWPPPWERRLGSSNRAIILRAASKASATNPAGTRCGGC